MRAPLLLALGGSVLLAGCSSGGGTKVAGATAGPTPVDTCSVDTAGGIPDRCVATSNPSKMSFPASAASISPLPVPPVQGILGKADNSVNSAKRTGTFKVTLAAGMRLGSSVLCLGRGDVTVDTVPKSGAFQKINCDDGPGANEFETEDATAVTAATTFTVTVTATDASRWSIAVYGTSQPLPTQS